MTSGRRGGSESAAGREGEGEREGERRGANGKKEELLTLKEDLEDTSSLLVDQARDTLDTSSSCETSDGGLGDALAVKGKRKKGRVSKGCSSR
jgi:hypothetical protein